MVTNEKPQRKISKPFSFHFGKVYKIDIFQVKHPLTAREIKHFNNLVREMGSK
jgi:hypothetical protein